MVNPFEQITQRLDSIEHLLVESINREPAQPLPEVGGIELAIEITQLAKPTIYTLVHKRKIPFHKQGKKLYFRRSELIDWITSNN